MPLFTYSGITKDNCLQEGYYHRTKNENCFFSVAWICDSGSNIEVICATSFDFLTGYFVSTSTSVQSSDTNIIMSGGFLGYKGFALIPSGGMFTLQVVESYVPTQTRQIG